MKNNRFSVRAALGLLCLVGSWPRISSAATLTVTNLADSGPGSLRDQVMLSGPGDTIVFAVNGTIVLNSFVPITHTLFVQGPGASKLAVSGNFADRVFLTSGSPVLLSGMTIRDGLSTGQPGTDGATCQDGGPGGSGFGGAIFNGLNNTDVLILSNCWLTGNTARGGRGGHGGNNPLSSGCMPGKGGAGGDAHGGAVYCMSFGCKLAVMNCTFSDNRAIGGDGGGGGDNYNPPPSPPAGAGGNGGAGYGGAVECFNTFAPGFTNCTVSGNWAVGAKGGAGGVNSGASSGGQGGNGGLGSSGGLYCYDFRILSCTIVSNSAVAGAGGVGGGGLPPGPNGNDGTGEAGGVSGYFFSCSIDLIGNTILADNYATTLYTNYFAALVDLGFNYLGDDYKGVCSGLSPTSRMGTVPAPLHAQLGPLAQNGGGLPTHAPLQGSPVIDWGSSFGTTADERGAPRPVGSPAISGGDGTDVGAFEFGSTPLGMSIGGTNGGQILITWPACYGDFALQSASNLLPGTWMSVTDMPVEVGGWFVITNTPSGSTRFYRLLHR